MPHLASCDSGSACCAGRALTTLADRSHAPPPTDPAQVSMKRSAPIHWCRASPTVVGGAVGRKREAGAMSSVTRDSGLIHLGSDVHKNSTSTAVLGAGEATAGEVVRIRGIWRRWPGCWPASTTQRGRKPGRIRGRRETVTRQRGEHRQWGDQPTANGEADSSRRIPWPQSPASTTAMCRQTRRPAR